MWVEAICFAFCRGISIYKAQVYSRLESPAHRGDFIVDVLEGVKVQDVMDRLRVPVTVPVETPLRQVISVMNETQSHYFPVTGEEGALVGIFSTNDIRRYLHDEPMWDLLVAEDVMTKESVMQRRRPEWLVALALLHTSVVALERFSSSHRRRQLLQQRLLLCFLVELSGGIRRRLLVGRCKKGAQIDDNASSHWFVAHGAPLSCDGSRV